jgi:hypothetical protein
MKKVKSGDRSPAAKGKGAPKNVDEYLARVPEPAQKPYPEIVRIESSSRVPLVSAS